MRKNEYLKENNYTVYMHKNKINGKTYIGITKMNKNAINNNLHNLSKTAGGYHWRYYEE